MQGRDPLPLLDECDLPCNFETLTNYVIPSRALHQFVMKASQCAAPGVISAAAALYNAKSQTNPFSAGLDSAASLLDAIRGHNEQVSHYSPDNKFGIELTEVHDARWFKYGRSPLPETEIYCVFNLIGHIRGILGSDWTPVAVEVSVANPVDLRNLALLARTKVSRISKSTAVFIPGKHLARPALTKTSSHARPDLDSGYRFNPEALDFVGSLRMVLRAYAKVGRLTVESASNAAGVSGRTLQRELKTHGLKFSELAGQVRFEIARDMLEKNLETSVTEIGYELGYKDPGSFSRAFRRYAGLSPVAYRRLTHEPESRDQIVPTTV